MGAVTLGAAIVGTIVMIIVVHHNRKGESCHMYQYFFMYIVTGSKVIVASWKLIKCQLFLLASNS